MKRFLTIFSILTVLLMNMSTSQAAISRLEDTELFSPKAYNDPPGSDTWSTGFGHQIGIHDAALRTQVITKAVARSLMKSDLSPLEIQINRDLKVTPTQNQFDALVDFGYNLGSGSLSKIIATWNTTHNTKAVTDQMLLYNKSRDKSGNLVVNNNLKSRREKGVAIFNSSLPPVSIKSALMAVAGVGVALYLLT